MKQHSEHFRYILLVLFTAAPLLFYAQAGNVPSQYWNSIFLPNDGDLNLCQSQPYQLVFQDEFNGSELDATKWTTYFPFTSDGSDDGIQCRFGGENSIHRDHNVFLDNGNLVLRTNYEPGSWYGANAEYSSGMIYSNSPWRFRRGKFEMRCKMPDTYAANMYWPAFWLFGGSPADPQGFATEIDGFEFCGNHMSDIKTSRHRYYAGVRYTETVSSSMGFSSSGGFHTYTIEWDYVWLRFYVDGVLMREASALLTLDGDPMNDCSPATGEYWWNPLSPNNDASLPLIVTTGMGLNAGNTPDPNDESFCYAYQTTDDPLSFPHDMEIDYIRAWQRDGVNLFLPPLYSGMSSELVGNELLCPGSSATYTLTGHYGNTAWSVGPGLTILSRGDNSITVSPTAGFNDLSYVSVINSNAPVSGANGTYTKDLWVGRPEIYVGSVDVAACGTEVDMVCHIHPSDGWGGDHRFWFGNQEITSQTYNGNTYPLDPWTPIVHTNTGGLTDFCIPYRMESTNLCGMDFRAGILYDNCVLGLCDINQMTMEELQPYFELSPNPAGGVDAITLKVLEQMPLEHVDYLKVTDFIGNVRVNMDIEDRMSSIDVTSWESGLYYVQIGLIGSRIVLRQEVRL